IGGPAMIRAAAKNYKHVVTLSDPAQYADFIRELDGKSQVSIGTSFKLAEIVFSKMSEYDSAVSRYLSGRLKDEKDFGKSISINLSKVADLRYGENPHQRGALYKDISINSGVLDAKQLSGKELSFNNWMDLGSALMSIAEFKEPSAVIIKHTNPCGLASASGIKEAFSMAHECDSLSAFGGIIGLNRKVTADVAKVVSESGFKECIIAPDYDEEALSILKNSKNLRIMKLAAFSSNREGSLDFRILQGGFLVQDIDSKDIAESDLKVVTKNKPAQSEIKTMLFAWRVVKNVKSNAIVLAKSFGSKCYATVGIGSGQVSRVDSVITAIRKAADRSKGAVLASDAFFPMPDSIEAAHSAGITSIIQPGGSIKDNEVIKKADQLGIAMAFTGIRHFRH
ncbi:MAG: bifunctional phosphoribosylaminoimidazolecarboxamide formyltransferase/IMP cyclohydrolase, partial [Candidatus Omnitrophica bacterium]|nr:bifunctional phosphoribosylaminoimidazolecarboxamide formyltransferase/IMP cyclohydrolase [Candidatus Omnitrophota bacterium]